MEIADGVSKKELNARDQGNCSGLGILIWQSGCIMKNGKFQRALE